MKLFFEVSLQDPATAGKEEENMSKIEINVHFVKVQAKTHLICYPNLPPVRYVEAKEK